MSVVHQLLLALRDHLATLPGIATCRIGLEAGLNPGDYPLVRIVPSRREDGPTAPGRGVQVLVYFSVAMDESSGLEDRYAAWLEMKETVVLALPGCPGVTAVYQDTITDEDRSAGYKMLAMRVLLLA